MSRMPFFLVPPSLSRAIAAVLVFQYLWVSFVLSQSSQRCYYPDQTYSPDDIPCNSTAPNAGCCGAGAWCLDNGLCYAGGVLSRGSCTDKNWQADECPPYCVNQNPSGGTPIMACGFTPPTFVCDLNGTLCNQGIGTFRMETSNFTLSRDQLDYAVAAFGETATNSSNSTGTSSNGTASASPQPTDAQFTSAAMAGVGVGVGAPLLLALLIVSFLLWKEKRKSKAPVNQANPSAGGPNVPPMAQYNAYQHVASPGSHYTSVPPSASPAEYMAGTHPDGPRSSVGKYAHGRYNSHEMDNVDSARYEMDQEGSVRELPASPIAQR